MSFSCPICAVDFADREAFYAYFEQQDRSHVDAYRIEANLAKDKIWNQDFTSEELMEIDPRK